MHYLSPHITTTFLERFKQVDNLSIEAVEERFVEHVAPYKVTPTGKRSQDLGTTMSCCSIGDIEILCSHWGAPMIGTVLSNRGGLSIGIPISGETELTDPDFGRIRTKPSEARVFCPSEGVSLVGEGPRVSLNLVFPLKALEDRARSFRQDELNEPLRFSPVFDLNGPAGHLIMNLIEYMKMIVVHEPASLENQLVTTSLQDHVMSTLLDILPHNCEEPASLAMDCAVPKSVRQSEEYMRAHADQPVTIEDLARHAGCSERALHNAFRNFRQKSPMVVLRDFRLEGAHDDLKSGENTITDIVYKWGFSNPGRFAKLYAEKFGCKPSETHRYAAA